MRIINYALVLYLIAVAAISATAQTNAFTYQGSLQDSGVAATGTYLMEFRLYDAGGVVPIQTLSNLQVNAANNVFTVRLDFTASTAFTGADRFLEVAIKRQAGDAYTLLTPRQKIQVVPFAVHTAISQTTDLAVDARGVGGRPSNEIIKTTDPRLTDIRTPRSGSAQYLQNQNLVSQVADFDLAGNGAANVFNARSEFYLAGQRVLVAKEIGNTYVGPYSGAANAGSANTFAGIRAGQVTANDSNSFFGFEAGMNLGSFNNSAFGFKTAYNSLAGSRGSFFGYGTGIVNLGDSNAFFGIDAGYANSVGERNLFFGALAAFNNSSGFANTMVGAQAGVIAGSATFNVYLGAEAGQLSPSGKVISLIGSGAGVDTSDPNIEYSTAIGSGSTVFTGDTIALGRSNGADKLVIYGLAGGGTVQLCRRANSLIATCSSSLRYKTDLAPFTSGMDFIQQLRPISFDWKLGGMKDVGFGAEEVAKVDPKFIVYNSAGEVEGLKYDRLSVVFVNAFKEQQARLAAQDQELAKQRAVIEALSKLAAADAAGTIQAVTMNR